MILFTARVRWRTPGFSHRTSGAVANVVTNVITTSIVKSGGDRMDRPLPMSRATSSTRPRVLSSDPITSASRQPKTGAARGQSTPSRVCPQRRTQNHRQAQPAALPAEPMSVRSPMTMKNAGSSIGAQSMHGPFEPPNTSVCRGTHAPSRNAPNTACSPIRSVTIAESAAIRTTTIAQPTRPPGRARTPDSARRTAGPAGSSPPCSPPPSQWSTARRSRPERARRQSRAMSTRRRR